MACGGDAEGCGPLPKPGVDENCGLGRAQQQAVVGRGDAAFLVNPPAQGDVELVTFDLGEQKVRRVWEVSVADHLARYFTDHDLLRDAADHCASSGVRRGCRRYAPATASRSGISPTTSIRGVRPARGRL